ncbi:MAG: hypothetical protein HY814_13460 [Candidatus Riflebacteria bacterium]|nr:hypothetical protein [Candidatus Riflebacteria bacterium]
MSVALKVGLMLSVLYAMAAGAALLSYEAAHRRLLEHHEAQDDVVLDRVFLELVGRPLSAPEHAMLDGVVERQNSELRRESLLTSKAVAATGVVALLFGLASTWIVVRHVTLPLKQLRADLLDLARNGPAPLEAEAEPPSGHETVSCQATSGGTVIIASSEAMRKVLDERGDEVDQVRTCFGLMVGELRHRMREAEKAVRDREDARRLAEIGSIAATVAHEVRNPLNTIDGAMYYLRTVHGQDADICEYTQLVEDQVSRITDVTAHLADAGRPLEAAREPLELNAFVRETALRLLRTHAAPRVDLEFVLASSLLTLTADRHQMTQALENLIENSLQAIDGNGKIVLETEMTDGKQVSLRVSDSGPGIPAEHRERVFEPFFSTRPGATGLGLTIVNRAALAHGGTVRVGTAPGGGALVEMTLPLGHPHLPVGLPAPDGEGARGEPT